MADNTRSLSDFSPEQISIAATLLAAHRSSRDGTQRIRHPVAIELNPDSAYVFLISVMNFAVAMLRENGILDDWLICDTCMATEGFREALEQGRDCCRSYVIRELGRRAA